MSVHWNWSGGSYPKDCAGAPVHITIAYVPNSKLGLNGLGSRKFPSIGKDAIVVGKVTVKLP